ncbi:MAG: hypothetical protein QOH30_3668 [Baekduia sp.]|jgi:hypothetical protein|nr:hypothetical protein [Baekduia sp.]
MTVTLKATVIAALVAVLVGGGVATGARSLITGADIRDGSITGRDIKPNSLSLRLFAHAARSAPALRGPRGAKGTPGLQGAAGPSGPQGLPGPGGAAGPAGEGQTVGTQYNLIQPNAQTVVQTVGPGAVQSAAAICPPGYAVLGGGYRSSGSPGAEVFFNDSFGSRDTWAVGVDNSGPARATIAVTAYCVPSGQPADQPSGSGRDAEDAIAQAVTQRRAGG